MVSQHTTSDLPVPTNTPSGERSGTFSRFMRAAGLALFAGLRAGANGATRGAQATGRGLNTLRMQLDDDLRAQLVELPVFGLTQLLPRDRPPVPRTQDVRESVDDDDLPILLVHGLGGSAGNFGIVRMFLSILGRRRVHAFDYRKFPCAVDAVPHLEAWLDATLKQYEDDVQVQILAHSQGGLITRKALQNASYRSRVERLITLGSPHRGTHLARLGGVPMTRVLRPDSELIVDLNTPANRAIERDELQMICVWTRRDVLVIPGSAGTLEHAENVEMPEATHVSWLVRPRQVQRVVELLDTRRPVVANEASSLGMGAQRSESSPQDASTSAATPAA